MILPPPLIDNPLPLADYPVAGAMLVVIITLAAGAYKIANMLHAWQIENQAWQEKMAALREEAQDRRDEKFTAAINAQNTAIMNSLERLGVRVDALADKLQDHDTQAKLIAAEVTRLAVNGRGGKGGAI